MRGLFLGIFKAYDGKVWHKVVLFKLKSYGVEGEYLSLLEFYLSNKEQWVVFLKRSFQGMFSFFDILIGSA